MSKHFKNEDVTRAVQDAILRRCSDCSDPDVCVTGNFCDFMRPLMEFVGADKHGIGCRQ